MFGGAPQGHFLRGAPGVHDQVFQLYISMLEDLIVDRWSAAEYLPPNLLNPLSYQILFRKYSATLHRKCPWGALPNIYSLVVLAIFRHQAEYLQSGFQKTVPIHENLV